MVASTGAAKCHHMYCEAEGMNRLVIAARFVTLSAAFVGVMAFAGAFVGAVCGMLLVLLSHTVLGLGLGTLDILPATMSLGLLGFMGLGGLLLAPYIPGPVFRTAPVVANSESN